MIFLGIETSCDETGLALYSPERGIIAEQLASSSEHQLAGDIVPEVAAREHSRKLLPLFQACLQQAGLAPSTITAIGYTRGPGLVGALMVGAAFAKSLAWALGKPALGIHHLEGHMCSIFLDGKTSPPHMPYLALLASGGHSHLFKVEKQFDYHLLGATRDDAAGEAFDKCAFMLGLGYPGGAKLSALAQKGNATRFPLPRPMLRKPGYDFSFSGLKTAVRYLLHDLGAQAQEQQTRADLAAAIEAAIVDSLIARVQRAARDTGLNRLVIAGGVSANTRLRNAAKVLGADLWLPPPRLCTDNGAMIACATALRYQAGYVDIDSSIQPLPVWSLGASEA